MQYPISTGQAAKLLGVPEPKLQLLIRKHRLSSLPAVSAGRRLWYEEHVLLAANVLGVSRADLNRRIRTHA